jgi:hypothetical protein
MSGEKAQLSVAVLATRGTILNEEDMVFCLIKKTEF